MSKLVYKPRGDFILYESVNRGEVRGIAMPDQAAEGKDLFVHENNRLWGFGRTNEDESSLFQNRPHIPLSIHGNALCAVLRL